MSYEITNLTDNEYNLITEMLGSISQIENILSSMTKSERIAWFRSKQFPRKIDFEKEISGTVYIVRSHFNVDATENLREKTERILKQKIT